MHTPLQSVESSPFHLALYRVLLMPGASPSCCFPCFHVINCHKNKKNYFVNCRVLLKMSVVLQHPFFFLLDPYFIMGFDMIAQQTSTGDLFVRNSQVFETMANSEMTSSW